MFMKNYLRNRGIVVLIMLSVALLTSWLLRPHPEIETFYVEGTVVEITEGQLTTMLVQLDNGDKTRLLVSQKAPDLHSTIQVIGTRHADGKVVYRLPESQDIQ